MQSEVAQVRVKGGQNRKLIAPADAASSTPLVLGSPVTAPALPVDESLAHPTTVANSHVCGVTWRDRGLPRRGTVGRGALVLQLDRCGRGGVGPIRVRHVGRQLVLPPTADAPQLCLPAMAGATVRCLGVCCLQDTPVRWVVAHRVHHQHSDEQTRSASPLVNFLWRTWVGCSSRTVRLTPSPPMIATRTTSCATRSTCRFERNRWLWVNRFAVLVGFYIGAGAGLRYWTEVTPSGGCTDGAEPAGVGVFVRTVAGVAHHLERESVTHIGVTATYETGENSRNNWLVGVGLERRRLAQQPPRRPATRRPRPSVVRAGRHLFDHPRHWSPWRWACRCNKPMRVDRRTLVLDGDATD